MEETPHAPSVKEFPLGMDLLDVALGIIVINPKCTRLVCNHEMVP